MPAKKSPKLNANIKTKKTHPKTSKWNRFYQANKLIVLLFVIGFALVGSYLLIQSNAQSDNRVIPFVDKPERGLTWAGLRANEHSALCGGHLLEMIDQTGNAVGCTHGPDPAPDDVDPRQPVEALSTGEDLGSYALTGSVACDGDGVSGNRVQAVYARASDQPDNYDTYAASFQAWAANIDSEFIDSALETGGNRRPRWVTDANCNIVVARVTLSPTGDDNFSNSANEIKTQGFDRSDRKYLMWVDATQYCGISQLYSDDSATSTNSNNRGPTYARVDRGCWGLKSGAEAHELMHTLGGVQYTAPNTSGGGHCIDENDRMCYADGPNMAAANGKAMIYLCPTTHERLFDCNHDDYFTTAPVSGSYLATHWNTANSSFLISGDSSGTAPPPAPVDATAPKVTITAPADGSKIKNNVTITANATDDIGVTKMEIYIDGYLKATSTSGSISTTWNTRKASRGTHFITVKAYDAVGNVGTSSVTVTK